jgi:hypothetical protein
MLISLEGQQVALINNQAEQLLRRLGISLAALKNGTVASERHLAPVGIKLEELLRDITLYDASGAVVPYEQQPLYQALYQFKASEAEFSTLQPDGSTLNLLINAAPLLAGDGTAVNVVLVWQDQGVRARA